MIEPIYGNIDFHLDHICQNIKRITCGALFALRVKWHHSKNGRWTCLPELTNGAGVNQCRILAGGGCWPGPAPTTHRIEWYRRITVCVKCVCVCWLCAHLISKVCHPLCLPLTFPLQSNENKRHRRIMNRNRIERHQQDTINSIVYTQECGLSFDTLSSDTPEACCHHTDDCFFDYLKLTRMENELDFNG